MTLIVGVDEVGRGCLAGPVYAAAVVMDEEQTLVGLKDSKLLSKKKDKLNFDKSKNISNEIEKIDSNIFSAKIIKINHDKIFCEVSVFYTLFNILDVDILFCVYFTLT